MDDSNLYNNSWLSGFIEGAKGPVFRIGVKERWIAKAIHDGHFSVRATLTDKTTKVECKFELSQKQLDHRGNDNLLFMQNIGNMLGCEVKSIRQNTNYPQYRLRTLNLQSNLKLEKYLEYYPLWGSKYFDLVNFLI